MKLNNKEKALKIVLIIFLCGLILMPFLYNTTWVALDELYFFFKRNTESIVVGIISSIVASSIIVTFSNRFRKTQIIISPSIAKVKNIEGGYLYVLKLINKSSVNVYEVNLELVLNTTYNSNHGTNIRSQKLKLSIDRLTFLSGRQKSDIYSKNALQFYTDNNALGEALLNELDWLALNVSFRDGYSGLYRTANMSYYTFDIVQEGYFAAGESFEIINS